MAPSESESFSPKYFGEKYFDELTLNNFFRRLFRREFPVSSNYPTTGGYEAYDKDEYFNSAVASIKQYVKNPEGKKVLDIGCAYGFLLKRLAPLFGSKNVFGVDISNFALKKAKETLKSANIKDLNLVQMDLGKNIPFPDGYFDATCALDVIEHVPQGIETGLKEIHRILKPYGIAVIRVPIKRPSLLGERWMLVDLDKSHVGVPTLDEFRNTLSTVGFEILDQHSYQGVKLENLKKLPKDLEVVVRKKIPDTP